MSACRRLSLSILAILTLVLFVASPVRAVDPRTALATIGYTGSIGGGTASVSIQGNVAYVGEGGGLTILDVSNPAHPTRIGNFQTSGYIKRVTLVGHIAYLAAQSAGMVIVDVANPAAPVLLGSYTLPQSPNSGYRANDVQVVGMYAYVICNIFGSSSFTGLEILDVSRPSVPIVVGSLGIDVPYKLQVADNVAYIATEYGLQSVDVHDPSAPKYLTQAMYPTGPTVDIKVVDHYGYVASGSYGFSVLNVADPALPDVADIDIDGGATAVSVNSNRAYVTKGDGGLVVLDVTDPTHPSILSTFNDPGSSVDVQAVDGRAYIARDIGGLQIVNVSDPAHAALLGTYPTWSAENVQLANSHAYIASGTTGVQVVDVSHLANPVQLGHFASSGAATWAQPVGTLMYVANAGVWNGSSNTGGGLQIVNTSDPAHPVLLGAYPLQDAESVQVLGNVAYVAASDGFFMLNVANPATPTLLGSYGTSSGGYGYLRVQVVNNLAYLLAGPSGASSGVLQILDVHNPANPTLLGSYATYNSFCMEIVGNLAYVGRQDALLILDVSDPAHIQSVGAYQTQPDSTRGVQVDSGYAYLAKASGDVEVVDVHDPAHPISLTRYVSNQPANDIQLANGYLYVADTTDGLQILTASIFEVKGQVYLPLVLR